MGEGPVHANGDQKCKNLEKWAGGATTKKVSNPNNQLVKVDVSNQRV